MASGVETVFPYMNSRNYPVADANVLLVSASGTVTFKWGIETAGTNKPTFYIIHAEGKWGKYPDVNHYPVVAVRDAFPGTFVTYASEAAMQADAPNQLAGTDTRTEVGVTYGKVGPEYWVLYRYGGNQLVWVPVRTPVAAGTATIASIPCDLYTCDVDVADIPEYLGAPMDADEVFDLCWGLNGKHASTNWDATFKLTPYGVMLHGDIFRRTEMFTPVAGEKARFEDEFVTAGQIEAGRNVNIWWRNTSGGGVTGYPTIPASGLNLIVECLYQVTGEYEDTFVYFDNTNNDPLLNFRDRQRFHDVPEDSLLPIKFEVEQGTTVKAYAYNNNLYVGHYDFDAVSPESYGDKTTNVLAFDSSTDITFELAPIWSQVLTEDGLATRKGTKIRAFVTGGGGMASWRLEASNIEGEWIFPANIGDTDLVRFANGKGTTAHITEVLPNAEYEVYIDRPLTIRSNQTMVGDDETLAINFRDDDLRAVCETPPMMYAPIEVVDRHPSQPRQRDVSVLMVPQHGHYSRHWFCDYNAFSTTRTIGYIGGGQIRSQLYVGPLGMEGEPYVAKTTIGDTKYYHDSLQRSKFNDPGAAHALVPYLPIPGFYRVHVNIEGIMAWANEGNIQRIIAPRLHLFISTGHPYSMNNPASDIFESCGVFGINDVVPNEPGIQNLYAALYASKPWSISGEAYIRISQGQTVVARLTYNAGNGENRFGFQVCHMSTRITKLAGDYDMLAPDQELFAPQDRYALVGSQQPTNYHFQNFQY